MASIPGLRPYDFVIANYPSLDDMYEAPQGLWRFGEWVNGGAWSTCEARMIMAYYRLGKYEDARRSVQKLFTYAQRFRMDNPFTDFGNDVYQPKEPINITYDAFGPAAALIRGLFDYRYEARGVTLTPQIPPGITQMEQLDPIRLGDKKLYLATVGQGQVTAVTLNGEPWRLFDSRSIILPYDRVPKVARIVIALGSGTLPKTASIATSNSAPESPAEKGTGNISPTLAALDARAATLSAFHDRLVSAGFGASYEAAHAQLAFETVRAIHQRQGLLAAGKLPRLPQLTSAAAADTAYQDAATRLLDGLDAVIKTYEKSTDPRRQKIFEIYQASGRK
jgi:hypothetical protein